MEVGGGGEAHIGLSRRPTEFPARVWYLPGGGEVPDEWLVTQGMRAWGHSDALELYVCEPICGGAVYATTVVAAQTS